SVVRIERLEFVFSLAVMAIKIKLYPDFCLFLVGCYIHLLAAFVELKQKFVPGIIIDLKGHALLVGTIFGGYYFYFLYGISDILQRLAVCFGIVFLLVFVLMYKKYLSIRFWGEILSI